LRNARSLSSLNVLLSARVGLNPIEKRLRGGQHLWVGDRVHCSQFVGYRLLAPFGIRFVLKFFDRLSDLTVVAELFFK
jgi:hypothetical protein